ncbi:MAG: IclR family transcriptional regulator [Peptococcaceae bacterium]|nr:IclR family transcriptional regulator [Peptococcaceae bacterium]
MPNGALEKFVASCYDFKYNGVVCMDYTDMRTESHVQSVARSLQIMELLAEENREMTLTEIADRLEWPKSTVHGILATLRDYRFVDQSSQNGRYRLGIRLFEMGHKVARNWEIRELAFPVMHKLNRQFNEMVQLATEDAGEVLYIEKVDSTNIIRIVSEIGARLPMHCSGLGKALLAHMLPAEVKNILTRRGMREMTRHTITNQAEMADELTRIRKQGYAVDNQEIMEGLRCVAAPIRDRNGVVRYAISVSGLSERIAGDFFEKVRDAVTDAAAEISRLMGYKGDP